MEEMVEKLFYQLTELSVYIEARSLKKSPTIRVF